MTIRTVSACFLYMQIFLTYLYNFFWEMLLAMRQETNPLALLSFDEPNRLG